MPIHYENPHAAGRSPDNAFLAEKQWDASLRQCFYEAVAPLLDVHVDYAQEVRIHLYRFSRLHRVLLY